MKFLEYASAFNECERLKERGCSGMLRSLIHFFIRHLPCVASLMDGVRLGEVILLRSEAILQHDGTKLFGHVVYPNALAASWSGVLT